jgi:hypothetical protein
MMAVQSKSDRLARKIRGLTDQAEPRDAVAALWRVALVAAVKAYGVPITASGLRDLADELERDLFTQFRGPLQ